MGVKAASKQERRGSPRAALQKEGNSSFQVEAPSSLEQEEFHETLQSIIESVARASQAVLYDAAWPSKEGAGHVCAGSDARRKQCGATGGRGTVDGNAGESAQH